MAELAEWQTGYDRDEGQWPHQLRCHSLRSACPSHYHPLPLLQSTDMLVHPMHMTGTGREGQQEGLSKLKREGKKEEGWIGFCPWGHISATLVMPILDNLGRRQEPHQHAVLISPINQPCFPLSAPPVGVPSLGQRQPLPTRGDFAMTTFTPPLHSPSCNIG